MYWIKKEGDEPCNRVEIKGSKVFECAPGWEVAEVYYDELYPNRVMVKFKKKEESNER